MIGCALRLRWYLFERSLWWAEAALSLNILRKPWLALLAALDYHQAAPIGYLVSVKLITSVLGPGEHALRLIPLLCGIAALPLFYAVAKRYVPRDTALLALVLFAVSRSAIYWSSEAKPYMSDVALTLAALLVAGWAMERELTARRIVALAAFGACALPLSFAMLFVLPGLGIALAWSAISRHDVRGLSRLGLVGVVWAMSFSVYYDLSLRHLGWDDFLEMFWADRFLTLSDLHQNYVLLSSMFIVPLDLATRHPRPVALLFLAGCVSLFRRDRGRCSALLVPLAFLMLASAARLHPLWHRMILFTLPLLLLPAVEGVMALARVASRVINRPVGFAIGAAVTLILSVVSLKNVWAGPEPFEEIRPLLSRVGSQRMPGDVIYVGELTPIYEYYKGQAGLGGWPYVSGRYLDREWDHQDDETLGSLRGYARVWALSGDPEVPARLDQLGRRLDTIANPDVTLYLYALRPIG